MNLKNLRRELRKLHRTFTYYDTALLCGSIYEMDIALQKMREFEERGVEPPFLYAVKYMAHKEMAETVCRRYLLIFVAPNTVTTRDGVSVRLEGYFRKTTLSRLREMDGGKR